MDYLCWHCGKKLASLILPMSRREECKHCGKDAHVCAMCEYYEADNRSGCAEERAEHVAEREKANFCDYFKPARNQVNSSFQKSNEGQAKLAALFGEEVENKEDKYAGMSAQEKAEAKLRDLLGN